MMQINEDKFIEKEEVKPVKQKKAKGKNNSMYIFFALITLFVGLIFFIFTLPSEDTQPQEVKYPTAPAQPVEMDIKLEEHQLKQLPPPVLSENNIFDSEKINEKLNSPVVEDVKEEVKEEAIEPEVVVVTQDKTADIEEIQEEPKKKEESNFQILEKEAIIKTNFFKFRGKNFYEGDVLGDMKVVEVTKESIKLKINDEIKEIKNAKK